MEKRLKPIPRFATEAEERRFWENNDSFDYVDWDKVVKVRFPNLLARGVDRAASDLVAPADGNDPVAAANDLGDAG